MKASDISFMKSTDLNNTGFNLTNSKYTPEKSNEDVLPLLGAHLAYAEIQETTHVSKYLQRGCHRILKMAGLQQKLEENLHAVKALKTFSQRRGSST